MSKLKDNLIFKLVLAVAIGIILGLIVNETIIGIISSIKHILGQMIFFTVPLIIIGFITPSITSLQDNASKMLGVALLIAYLSSIGAALLSMVAGYGIIPGLSIDTNPEGLRTLPELVFELNIPPVMEVMSALVLSIILGLTVIWTKSKSIKNILDEFHNIMMAVVKRIVIPILPIFIATTFASLAYEGSITKQFPVFIEVIL